MLLEIGYEFSIGDLVVFIDVGEKNIGLYIYLEFHYVIVYGYRIINNI